MSSLAHQRQNSRAKCLERELGPTVSTWSFREKLQLKLRRMDMPKDLRTRLRALIQADPVAAMKEMIAYTKNEAQK